VTLITVPVAVVGVSWRSAATSVRAQLAALAGAADPVQELRAAGYVSGAVRVATCSRTEWILTADQPEWAAALLKGALLSRIEGLGDDQLHVRAGGASLHYLLRVAVGLDSVAEGEGAVGRQVLKSFESARESGLTDRRMRQVWKQVERVIRARRESAPGAQSRGVQSLVRAALIEAPVRRVAILGRGDFGLAMERSLRGASRWEVETFSRQSMPDLMSRLEDFEAVVLCTGAIAPWLELPRRHTPGLCLDAGSPPQLRAAPGWRTAGLDELLARPDMQLPEDERQRLEHLVLDGTQRLAQALDAPSSAPMLAAIDAERQAFLNEQLPGLLVGLPRDQAQRVRQAVGAFTHAILQKTREVSS
jgi:glutamyl-tRNA reductase